MSISNRKVVIVGAGHVGSHVGYALISQSLADEIVYIDSDHAKAVAQALDLTDATNYLPVRTKVTAGDYSDAKDAQIMIIAAGPLPTGNQTRMDTLGQTIAILKDVTKSIKESGFVRYYRQYLQSGGRYHALHPAHAELGAGTYLLHQHHAGFRKTAPRDRAGNRH